MSIRNLLILSFVSLQYLLASCNKKSDILSGKYGKFWIEYQTSVNPEHTFAYGMYFCSNGTGIFYSRHDGYFEQLDQPGLYDAKPSRIGDCFFFWKIANDSLYITPPSNKYTIKYKIVSLNDMELSLVNSDNDSIKYDFVREIYTE